MLLAVVVYIPPDEPEFVAFVLLLDPVLLRAVPAVVSLGLTIADVALLLLLLLLIFVDCVVAAEQDSRSIPEASNSVGGVDPVSVSSALRRFFRFFFERVSESGDVWPLMSFTFNLASFICAGCEPMPNVPFDKLRLVLPLALSCELRTYRSCYRHLSPVTHQIQLPFSIIPCCCHYAYLLLNLSRSPPLYKCT